MLSVAVVDRYPVTRNAIAHLMRSNLGQANIVEFASPADAIEAVGVAPVELVLCGPSTCALWRAPWLVDFLAAVRPGKVAVLSYLFDPTSCRRVMDAGVDGYALMTQSEDILAAAIELVLAGGRYAPVTPRTAARPASAASG